MEDPFELNEGPREILRLKVKTHGEYVDLVVNEDDEPIEVARRFCSVHRIGSEKCLKLAFTIQKSIEQLIEEEEQASFQEEDEEESVEDIEEVLPKRNIGQELYQKGRDMKHKVLQKIQSEKQVKAQSEAKELTFKPETIPSKKTITGGTPRYEMLYSIAKVREEKAKKLQTLSSCTPKATRQEIQQSSQRLYENWQRINEKKQQMVKERDEKLAQECFNPKIGRPPTNPPKPKPVHCLGKTQPQPFKPSTSAYSSLLLNMKKKKSINKLFRLLAPAENRVVYNNIDFDALPEYVLRLLAPFFEELVKVPQGLTLDDFSVAMENLIRILSPTERDELFNPEKFTKPVAPQPEAPRTKNPQRIGTLYQRCVENSTKTQSKIDQERKKLVQDEIAQCTFNPQTTFYKADKSITKKLFERQRLAEACNH